MEFSAFVVQAEKRKCLMIACRYRKLAAKCNLEIYWLCASKMLLWTDSRENEIWANQLFFFIKNNNFYD